MYAGDFEACPATVSGETAGAFHHLSKSKAPAEKQHAWKFHPCLCPVWDFIVDKSSVRLIVLHLSYSRKKKIKKIPERWTVESACLNSIWMTRCWFEYCSIWGACTDMWDVSPCHDLLPCICPEFYMVYHFQITLKKGNWFTRVKGWIQNCKKFD